MCSEKRRGFDITLGYEPIEWPTPAIFKMLFFIL